MRFETYQDAAGEWRWRAIAINGNIVANSGEGYKNRVDCEAMIDRFKGIQVKAPQKPKPSSSFLSRIFHFFA